MSATTLRPRAPKRKHTTWTPGRVPPCFASGEQWADWLDARDTAHAPCEDCTPQYKRQMCREARCIRPEAAFFATKEGLVGLAADDPRYARAVMGLTIAGGAPVGPAIERTPAWRKLLKAVARRAHPLARRAIEIWLRRGEEAA